MHVPRSLFGNKFGDGKITVAFYVMSICWQLHGFGWIAFTFPFNSTGQPAISLPNGFNKAGLPLAIQLVGRPGDEAGIIALAAEFERARPWKDKHPPI